MKNFELLDAFFDSKPPRLVYARDFLLNSIAHYYIVVVAGIHSSSDKCDDALVSKDILRGYFLS